MTGRQIKEMKRNRNNVVHYEEYQSYGNTVRRAKPNIQDDRIEEHKKKKRESHAAQRNRERALAMSPGYMIFLVVSIAFVVIACLKFIQLQSQLNSRMDTIASMEAQLSDLKISNDETNARIATSVDLNNIKEIAINQLGMVYSSEDQVITYAPTDSDYVEQYKDIP